MTDGDLERSFGKQFEQPTTVGGLAELYLGNILYAIELASLSLEEQGKGDDAAFYRAIGRKLAEAHGAAKKGQAAR